MPIRKPTPEELEFLKSKGVDTSQLPAELDIDDNWKELNASKVSQTGAIASTLKAHAGGILGGGAGVIGTGGLLTLAGVGAPFTGGMSIPASLLALGAIAGGGVAAGYGGQKAQDALLSDETNRQLQTQFQEAQQAHPATTAITDIAASALASGGFPSIATPARAVGGIAKSLLGKGASEIEKSAMKNIAIQSVINPAINTGIGVATTGQLPSAKELGEQALGGALFAGHNPLLGRLSPHANVGNEPTPEPTTKTSIAETAPQQPPSAQPTGMAGNVIPLRLTPEGQKAIRESLRPKEEAYVPDKAEQDELNKTTNFQSAPPEPEVLQNAKRLQQYHDQYKENYDIPSLAKKADDMLFNTIKFKNPELNSEVKPFYYHVLNLITDTHKGYVSSWDKILLNKIYTAEPRLLDVNELILMRKEEKQKQFAIEQLVKEGFQGNDAVDILDNWPADRKLVEEDANPALADWINQVVFKGIKSDYDVQSAPPEESNKSEIYSEAKRDKLHPYVSSLMNSVARGEMDIDTLYDIGKRYGANKEFIDRVLAERKYNVKFHDEYSKYELGNLFQEASKKALQNDDDLRKSMELFYGPATVDRYANILREVIRLHYEDPKALAIGEKSIADRATENHLELEDYHRRIHNTEDQNRKEYAIQKLVENGFDGPDAIDTIEHWPENRQRVEEEFDPAFARWIDKNITKGIKSDYDVQSAPPPTKESDQQIADRLGLIRKQWDPSVPGLGGMQSFTDPKTGLSIEMVKPGTSAEEISRRMQEKLGNKQPQLTVGDVIANAQKSDKKDPHVALLSQLEIDPESAKVPVVVSQDLVDQSPHGRSHYNPNTDQVVIAPKDADNKYIVAHEILHAATSKKLPVEFENKRGTVLKALMDEYEKAGPNKNIRDLIGAYKETAKQLGIEDRLFVTQLNKKGLKQPGTGLLGSPDLAQIHGLPHGYAMGDLHEFISEALNNRTFQQHLNELPSGLKDGQTMWSRLVNAIRRLLGVDVKHNSMLERVLKPIEELAKQDRPGAKERYATNKGIEQKDNRTEHIRTGEERLPTEAISSNRDEQGGERIQEEKANVSAPLPESKRGHNLTEQELKEWTEKLKPYEQYISEHRGPNKAEGLAKWFGNIRKRTGQSMEDSFNGWVKDATRGSFEQHFAPPEEKDEIPRAYKGGKIGGFFRSMIDKIRDIDHPAATKVADALHNVLTERQHYIGKQLNPIIQKSRGLTSTQDARLEAAARYERENDKDAPLTMFRTKQERDVFNQARQSLDADVEERIKNEQPINDHGSLRLPKKDSHYWPTTTNPKIVEQYRDGSMADKSRLEKIFLDYQKKVGVDDAEAQENFTRWRNTVMGQSSRVSESGNAQFFAAHRLAQGVPLPPEFTRPGFVKNLESYFHRSATDTAYFKNVESDPKVMAALGETHDAWGKPIKPDAAGSIAKATPVAAQLNEIKGEVGGAGFHNEKALSSLATTLFIGPGTTIHKAISNFVGMTNYVDNPYQMARVLAGIIHDTATTGIKNVVENGVVKMTARSATDMFNQNLTFAEKMQALAKTVRDVYSLGDLTDKWGAAILQAGLERLMPVKVAKANAGDLTAQQLIKRLDPSYTKGKTYGPEDNAKLTSALVNSIHGTGDGRTMPAWMAGDSEISGFFKLSHWGISQTNRFMSDIYTPARNGNFTPLLTALFGSAVGGYLIKELREKLQAKKGQIPSIQEIQSSSKGLSGNIPLLGYNLMAALSYAGFGGMLTQMAKIPIDKIYKNTSQGATFPLDEIATDLAHTLGQATTAIANDPNLNWLHLTEQLVSHFATTNFQLGRVVYNQAIDHGLISGLPAEKKELSDKLGQLRRFDMTEGLPYAEQDQAGNPYMNIEQKRFKMEQNPEEIAKQLPPLINNIIEKYSDKPDVMMSKLKALKENQYATFPSLESMPLSFMKYMTYLSKLEGPQAAQDALVDYMRHKAINEVRSSVIP